MDFITRIQNSYSKLSPGHKIVAEYAISNTLEFITSTIVNISNKTNVSETTVLRFAYALEYESFSKMQQEVKENQLLLKNNINSKFEEGVKGGTQNSNSIHRDIELLKKIEKSLDYDKIEEIAKVIVQADNIKVVGYRASFSIAHWLYVKLNMLRDDVSLLKSLGTDTTPNELMNFNNTNSVYIMFSFPSYFKETLRIAKLAKEQNAKLIVISDRHLSSVAQMSDISLIVDINADSENLISITTVLSVLNLITETIENSNREKYNKRFRNINRFMADSHYYLE